MDFRREATDKLRCYESKRQSLHRLADETRRLEDEFYSIRGAVSVDAPVSGGGELREDAVVNNIALRGELARAKKSTEDWLRIVDGALDSLTDEERHVLIGMYVNQHKGGVDRLCAELHVEKTALYTRRNNALRHFTMALYGVTEL